MSPYAPPQVQPFASPYTAMGTSCPRCQGANLHRPGFTWWGGIIGPKLLNHTVCGGCGFGFNAKTGKSNQTAIAIYLGVGVALAIFFIILRIALD